MNYEKRIQNKNIFSIFIIVARLNECMKFLLLKVKSNHFNIIMNYNYNIYK